MSDLEPQTDGSVASFPAGPEAQADTDDQNTTWAGAPVETHGQPYDTHANLLFAVLFLTGAGCLYLMSPRKGLQEASGDQKLAELRVDNALSNLANLDAGPSKAMDVVNTFYYQAKQRQIPLKDLKSNPFILKIPKRPKPIAQAPNKPPPAPKEVQKKPAQEMEEVKKLVLQSVLTGSREPVAMISNNLLTEGQKISGWLLTKIDPRSVTLTWQDKTYVLRMLP